LPTPRPGQILGLVGTNGIGKSTALNILAGKLKPNLGKFNVILMLFVFFNQKRFVKSFIF
jgi:translation initiation factor RLI1